MKLRGVPFYKVNIFLLFITGTYVFDPWEFESRFFRHFEVYFCSHAPGRHPVVTRPFFWNRKGRIDLGQNSRDIRRKFFCHFFRVFFSQFHQETFLTIYMVEVYSIARVYNLNFSYIFNRYFDLIYPHGFDGSSETMGQMVSFSIFIIFVSPVDISCFGINSILHNHLTLP